MTQEAMTGGSVYELMERQEEWLKARGDARRSMVEEVASLLLRDYLSRRPQLPPPVRLPLLAKCHNASIVTVGDLGGKAGLLPVPGGFALVVSDELESARLRMSIAHELAHIAFYDPSGRIPHRVVPSSGREEQFCFDVARRLLVPVEHVEQLNLRSSSSVREVFDIFVQRLRLSRPVAARAMLDDHALVEGVAGRWIRTDGDWVLEPRGRAKNAHASSWLSTQRRRELHAMAKRWLDGDWQLETEEVVANFEQSPDAAFVVVGHVA